MTEREQAIEAYKKERESYVVWKGRSLWLSRFDPEVDWDKDYPVRLTIRSKYGDGMSTTLNLAEAKDLHGALGTLIKELSDDRAAG